jgi:DNA-binding NarL/FixJ family response regulator
MRLLSGFMFGIGIVWYTYPYLDKAFDPQDRPMMVRVASDPTKKPQRLPDVAVLDIQMPKASGIEVTRWVRANFPKVGVLILTAYDDDPYVLAVLQAGANGYVLKTASPADLIQAVRDVNIGKSVLDPSITQKLLAQLSHPTETNRVEQLTEREMEVLGLAAKGFTNKAIGVQLGISDRTVQGHLAHIFNKLQAGSRTEAVMRAVSLGWISQSIGNITEE